MRVEGSTSVVWRQPPSIPGGVKNVGCLALRVIFGRFYSYFDKGVSGLPAVYL